MREALIHIPHDEFENIGLGEFVSLARDAGLSDVTELVCQSKGCLVVITVDEPLDEAELPRLDCLDWWERLTSGDQDVSYLCKVTFRDDDEPDRPLNNRNVANDEIRVSDRGLDVTLVGPQEEVSREVGQYGDAGMTVLLERIGEYRGPAAVLDSLTARQREILETAYDLGYFDVPRRLSTADIAAELDLDPSTVSEHLQRAERNLLARLLDAT